MEVSQILLDVPGTPGRGLGWILGHHKTICFITQNLGLEQYRLRVDALDRHATYAESCAIHFCVISNQPRQHIPERSRERKMQVPPTSGNVPDQLAGQTPLRRYYCSSTSIQCLLYESCPRYPRAWYMIDLGTSNNISFLSCKHVLETV